MVTLTTTFMKQKIKIGVICLARKTFDFTAAKEVFGQIQGKLKNFGEITWEIIPELIIEVKDAQQAGLKLRQACVDGWICISGTFALGHLVLELHKQIQQPILLWGLNELPYDGGRIRLNSVCGLNLNASNLYKAGVKTFQTIVGDDYTTLNRWLDALRIKKTFQDAHIGLVGYRAQGFFNLDVDELNLFQQTGVLIDHFELTTLLDTQIKPELEAKYITQISQFFDSSQISETQVQKVAQLAAKINLFMETNNLSNIALRCWPEFANDFGISPCATMSLLQAEGKVITCEGDILGSLTMLAHQAIGAETPFLADFSQVDLQEDFALLWHCGVAPCNLWDGKCVRSLDGYFAGGKGVTADFVMKSGHISLSRIDYAPGEYRIFLQSGEAIPMTKDIKGTYMKAKFPEGVKSVLDKIIYNGIAHHISVVYGEFEQPFRVYAKIMGWKIIS